MAADGFTVPSTIVPADVVNACIDLAVRAGSGEDTGKLVVMQARDTHLSFEIAGRNG
ncbi:hypothetical protein ACQ4WY_02650 [Janthinobacterium sp. LB2P49]|uniref:hypothetical protein n=1 Tax=Janthinobacterium sp. LB2P49 TaxID=3424198 RepID=UPI003F27292A